MLPPQKRGLNSPFRMGRMRAGQMKFAFSFGLALVVSLACAQGAPHSSDQVHLGGKEYVRVADWAKGNDLKARWLKSDETMPHRPRRPAKKHYD